MPLKRRTVALPLCTIDPDDETTHTQRLSLPFSPFSDGNWTVAFQVPCSGLRQYSPARVFLKYPYFDEVPWSKAILSVGVAGKTFKRQLSEDDSEGNNEATCGVSVGRPTGRFEVSLVVQAAEQEPSAADRCFGAFAFPYSLFRAALTSSATQLSATAQPLSTSASLSRPLLVPLWPAPSSSPKSRRGGKRLLRRRASSKVPPLFLDAVKSTRTIRTLKTTNLKRTMRPRSSFVA